MRKLFLLIAFTGIIGAASAITVSTLTKSSIVTVGGDEKKDEKKKCEKGKACCKSGDHAKACSGEKAEGKACCKKGEEKACCKGKTTAAPATPEKK